MHAPAKVKLKKSPEGSGFFLQPEFQPDLPTGHHDGGFSHNAWNTPRTYLEEFLDLFCGAGGSGSGIIKGFERWLALVMSSDSSSPKLDDILPYNGKVRGTFVNHNWDAVKIHATNHSRHRHYCTGVDNVDPDSLFPLIEQILRLLWSSPECTNHSNARGGRPINDQSRSSMFCVVRWIRHKRPEISITENVAEVRQFGRARQKVCKKTGRYLWMTTAGVAATYDSRFEGVKADKRVEVSFKTYGFAQQKKFEPRWKFRRRMAALGFEPALTPDRRYLGEHFVTWKRKVMKCGYWADDQIKCSADYGDPTSRKRLYVYAVRINSGKKIVWPDPTHFKPDKDGNVPKGYRRWRTARDIIDFSNKGISMFNREKYGKKDLSGNTMRRAFVGLDKFGLRPYITANFGENTGQEPRATSVDGLMWTVTSRGAGNLIQPIVIQPFVVKNRGTNNAVSVDSPAPTVTAGGQHLGVATPFVVNMKGKSNAVSVDASVPTVTAHAMHLAVATPQVPGVDGTPMVLGQQSGATARPVDEPVPTVATAGGVFVIQPFITNFYGRSNAASVDEPVDTVTTKDRFGLANGFVLPHPRTKGDGPIDPDKPMPTVTATSCDFSVVQVEPFILPKQRHGRDDIRGVDVPVQTIDCSSWNIGLVQTGPGPTGFQADIPVEWKIAKTIVVDKKTYTLIEVNGWNYLPVLIQDRVILIDVTYRMFTVRELARAQGFSDSFKWSGTQEEIVKAIGNSVSCGIAEALVFAALTQNPDVRKWVKRPPIPYMPIAPRDGFPKPKRRVCPLP